MNEKRLTEIVWELENDPAKFQQHAHEYFKEALPYLKEQLCKKEEKKKDKK